MPTRLFDDGVQSVDAALVVGKITQAKLHRIDFLIGGDLIDEALAAEATRDVARGAQVASAQWRFFGWQNPRHQRGAAFLILEAYTCRRHFDCRWSCPCRWLHADLARSEQTQAAAGSGRERKATIGEVPSDYFALRVDAGLDLDLVAPGLWAPKPCSSRASIAPAPVCRPRATAALRLRRHRRRSCGRSCRRLRAREPGHFFPVCRVIRHRFAGLERNLECRCRVVA